MSGSGGSSRRLYLVGMVLLVVGIVGIGAWALSLIAGGQPAFPVEPIGRADVIALNEHAVFTDDRFLPRYGNLDLGVLSAEAGGALPEFVWVPGAEYFAAQAIAAGMPGMSTRDLSMLQEARDLSAANNWTKSIALYTELERRNPGMLALAIERANVLSWSGQYAMAANAYAQAVERGAGPDAFLKSAQNHWFAGDALAADIMLERYLVARPGDAVAEALLIDVRRAASPGVATAERWARSRDRLLEQLIYARALVADTRYAESLPVYRRVIALGASDSSYLELAAAATAADSSLIATDALRAYLDRHDDARDTRLALARALAWRGDYDAALPEYDRLLRSEADRELAFERAQLLMWSGQDNLARIALNDVVAQDSTHALAHQMLGDLARYKAEWALAVRHYQAALRAKPENAEVATLLAQSEQGLRIAQQALRPTHPATVTLDAVTDRAGFRYLELGATQTVVYSGTRFRLTALQTVPGRSLGGVNSVAAGVGGRIDASRQLTRTITADVGAGISNYGATGQFITLSGAVRFAQLTGITGEVRVAHEPAVRRAATLLALHAQTMVTSAQLNASARVLGGELFAVVEGERFTSRLGGTERGSLGLNYRYPLTDRLALTGSLSAVSSTVASPMLRGWGSLVWAPELYVQPGAGVAYRIGSGPLRIDLTAGGGYAIARERAADARFAQGSFPAFSTGAAVTYTTSRWELGAGAQYGGAVGNGYRSSALQLRASYNFR